MYKIISLLGKRGHGKDYTADLISTILKSQTSQIAFGDPLKLALMEIFNLEYDDVYTQEGKNNRMINLTTFEVVPLDESKLSNIFELSKEKDFFKMKNVWIKIRDLLQYFGTDVMQPAFGQRIWINSSFRLLSKDRINIITDVRLISEYKAVKSLDAVTIRIINPNVENNDTHVSETQLDEYPADYTIINNYPNDENSEYLKTQIIGILTELNEKEGWNLKL